MALACPWVLLGWGCRHQAVGALSSVRASSMHTHSRCREVSMRHPGNGWGWCPSQISRCACHPLVCTPLHNRQGPCLAPSVSSVQRVCECTEPSVPAESQVCAGMLVCHSGLWWCVVGRVCVELLCASVRQIYSAAIAACGRAPNCSDTPSSCCAPPGSFTGCSVGAVVWWRGVLRCGPGVAGVAPRVFSIESCVPLKMWWCVCARAVCVRAREPLAVCRLLWRSGWWWEQPAGRPSWSCCCQLRQAVFKVFGCWGGVPRQGAVGVPTTATGPSRVADRRMSCSIVLPTSGQELGS